MLLRCLQIRIGSDFLLLLALLFFFDLSGLILSAIPVILIHELGHVTALRLYGIRPVRLSASLAGLSLDYDGDLSGVSEIFSALAGPVFGLIFAFACSLLGKKLENNFLLFTAGIGLLLNSFNLLPALPLDGGRAVRGLFSHFKWGKKLGYALGVLTTSLLIMAGLFFISLEKGWALFIVGVCLLIIRVKGT